MTDAPPGEPPADPRDVLIREQAQLIAAQAEQIAALEAVVADLREQLETAARAGSRNSGNSSMPPSSDDLPGRKPPRRQRRAAERAEKNKRGKQPGSPGASMTWEVPDRTEDHHPGGACSCGRDLADAADLGVARSYQQEEIRAAAAERVQHDLHESRCACGRAHVAARPAGVPDSALSIGPRLRALAVYLGRREGSLAGSGARSLVAWRAVWTVLLKLYRVRSMKHALKMTGPVQQVLRAMLEDAAVPRYGLQISAQADVEPGTLYPVMGRLERVGWVESSWEDPDLGPAAGRPRRRYYQLTRDGAEQARVALAEISSRREKRLASLSRSQSGPLGAPV